MLRAPELDAGLQTVSHQIGLNGQNHLPRPAGHAVFDAAQDTAGLLVCECTLSAEVQLFIHQYPQVLLRAALNPFIRQPVSIVGIAPTVVQYPALALLNLMRFTWAHFSSLSRSLWMAFHPSGVSTAPFSLVSSANLLRVHSLLLSMSLMKLLNSTRPNMDP